MLLLSFARAAKLMMCELYPLVDVPYYIKACENIVGVCLLYSSPREVGPIIRILIEGVLRNTGVSRVYVS